MTPASIIQVPAEGDWKLRIVENLYPVLDDDRTNRTFAFWVCEHTIERLRAS